MSTEWECTLGRKNYPDQIITFKVRVKGRPKIKVTIGGLELNNSLSDSSELQYDNIAYYWYEDGETIDLVCHNLNVGFLYLEYFDASGTKLVETARMLRKRPPNFKKIMNIDDNNHIIDCKYEAHDFHYGYTYRTIFKLRSEASSTNDLMLKTAVEQEESLEVRKQNLSLLKKYSTTESREGLNEAFANVKKNKIPVKVQRIYNTKITVNNLKLVPINISIHGDKEYYQHKFFENQILKVTCKKNKDLPGYLQFGIDNNEHLKSRIHEEVENVPWKKTISLDTTGMTLEHLRCDIVGYSTANIMLVLDTIELYILGLPTDNMMYQYNNDTTTWIVDYRYSVNETVNLTCVARTQSDFRWIFGNSSTNATLESKNISNVFTLQADHNEMKIICEGKSLSDMQRVIIRLHRIDSKRDDILFNITPVIYSDFSDTDKIYVVLENQPFNITLINYNASKTVCCNYYIGFCCFPIMIKNIPEENNPHYIIMVAKASEDMSTVWKCNTLEHDAYDQYMIFDLHVKGTKNVKVTIGGIEQKTAVLNSSELGYDAIAHYWYEVGEAIDLDCINRHVGGTIRLSYYDGNGTKLIETDPLWQRPINFRKTMYVSNDGDMVDCVYKTEYYNYKYAHRTVFKLKNNSSSSRLININVNSFRLIPISVSNDIKEVYQYKYFEGQKLMVTCEKDKAVPGHLQFQADDNEFMESTVCEETTELQEQNLELWKKTIKLNTEHINHKHLTCNVSDDQLQSTADIMFLSETKELFILGLSTSDMIYQYNKNRSTWILDYNYTEGQVVYLTCVAKTESNLRWIFTNSSEEVYDKRKSIRYKFAMKPELNEMAVTCEATESESLYTQRVIVNLHRGKKSLKTSGPGDDTALDTSNSTVIVIISFSVAILVSIFGITIVCCMCFKGKDISDNDTVTHQEPPSTSQHQLRPLPEVPRQPQYNYDYVISHSSPDYAEVQPDAPNSNQQNTMYYWAF